MFDAELTSDDGTYAPIFIRLAWHASGTYDKETKTGGSSKATMRFIPEKDFEVIKIKGQLFINLPILYYTIIYTNS